MPNTTSQRETIVNNLVTLLDTITDLKTVKVVSNMDNKYPFDLTQAELPDVKIYLTDETPKYNPGKHAMNKISPDLYFYSLEWDKDSISTAEEILKLIRDKIGTDLTLSGSCVNIDIGTIVNMEMTYPLIMYKTNLMIWYESRINNL